MALDMASIDSLKQSATSGAQFVLGIGQKFLAERQRKKAQKFFDKNKYEVPAGVKSMLDVVRGVASQREMPGSDIQRQRVGQATSQGVETAKRVGQSSSDVLGALQGLYSKQMDTQQNMALENADYWRKNQMQYANALNTMGQYQSEKWNYNVLYPYMQRMSAASEMGMAGNENMASAIKSNMGTWAANQEMNTMEQDLQNFRNRAMNGMPNSQQQQSNVPLPQQLRSLGGPYEQPNVRTPLLPMPNIPERGGNASSMFPQFSTATPKNDWMNNPYGWVNPF